MPYRKFNSILVNKARSVFLLLFCSIFIHQHGLAQSAKKATSLDVTPQEFQKLIQGFDARTLLDVRTSKEVSEGRIKESINIDYYASDFKEQLSGLDKEKPILVYCRSGVRSGRTVRILKDLGFKEIYNLSGGMRAWLKEGLPLQ